MDAIRDGNKPITVFYSYAYKDKSLRDKLAEHLILLKRQGFISDWSDQNVKPGQERKKEINKNLLSADIILLLVSANFMATNYCGSEEVDIAMQRHEAGEAWVIPILVRDVDWEISSIGKLQALPYNLKPVASWSDRDKAFAEISKNIRSLVMDLQATKNKVEENNIREGAQILLEQATLRLQRKKERDLYKTITKASGYSIGQKIQHKIIVLRRNFSIKAISKRSKGFSLFLLFCFSVLDLIVLPAIVFQWIENSFIAAITFVLSMLLFSMGITNKNNIIAAAITFVYCVIWDVLGSLYLRPAYYMHLNFLNTLLISFILSCLQLVLFRSRTPRKRRLPFFPKG